MVLCKVADQHKTYTRAVAAACDNLNFLNIVCRYTSRLAVLLDIGPPISRPHTDQNEALSF